MPENAAVAACRFDALVEAFAGRPGVTGPGEPGRRGFGSAALKVDGSIFAMRMGDRLIVKLPRARVTFLIDSGIGEPFDAGKGTPMKEWLAVVGTDDGTWRALTEEALTFVGSRPRPG